VYNAASLPVRRGRQSLKSTSPAHECKTASLFEVAACCGALASRNGDPGWALLGRRVGAAYQIADVSGTSNVLGKPVAQDEPRRRPNLALEIGCDAARRELNRVVAAAIDDVPECQGRSLLQRWLSDTWHDVLARSTPGARAAVLRSNAAKTPEKRPQTVSESEEGRMPAIHDISGVWRGKLVDIQGFEGDVELTLKAADDGQLQGTFAVTIGGHHGAVRRRGEVRGKSTEKQVSLALTSKDKELPVKISATGDVLNLRGGGAGLRTTYQISAKGYSPLQGGVLCASKDRKDVEETATVAVRNAR
jgi:hypothetical protein